MVNPPFTIVECSADPELNTSNDLLFFSLVVETELYQFRHAVNFDELRAFAKEHRKEDDLYFDKLRSDIQGLGPKLQVMRKLWKKEGYDIIPLVHAWMDATVNINDLIQQQINDQWATLVDKTSPEYLARLVNEKEEKYEDDDEDETDEVWNEDEEVEMDPDALRMEKFQDALIQHANRLALEIWPEFLEREPETIRDMGNILISNVTNMAEALSQLAYDGE